MTMQTWVPVQWNTMGMIPHECWGDEEIRERTPVHRPPMAIFTGEDEQAGYDPDDFDGMIRLGLYSDREVEDAAFRLCQALKYDSLPLAQTDEIRLANVVLPEDISDDLTEVAKWYIDHGAGIDGLVRMFSRAEGWQNGAAVRCAIVDFVCRLRWVCGLSYNGGKPIRLELTDRSQEMVRRESYGGKHGWMWQHLDNAIRGKLN